MAINSRRYLELADFLKTRRARILPSQVGLSSGPRRRTPGLRREEVAHLAGIGLTWYTWLEQGRHIHVSAQVIESISKVLLLDQQERLHFYTLANQPPPAELPPFQGTINPVLQNILDNLALCPAYIMDARWNVLAWNQAARLVFGYSSEMKLRERNIIWMMFTNKDYKQLFLDWENHTRCMLGRFRSACDQYLESPWIMQLVRDIMQESKEFESIWSYHDLKNNDDIYQRLSHPLVGTLFLEFSSFDVSDNSGFKLIIYTPVANTDTDIKIQSLIERNLPGPCFSI